MSNSHNSEFLGLLSEVVEDPKSTMLKVRDLRLALSATEPPVVSEKSSSVTRIERRLLAGYREETADLLRALARYELYQGSTDLHPYLEHDQTCPPIDPSLRIKKFLALAPNERHEDEEYREGIGLLRKGILSTTPRVVAGELAALASMRIRPDNRTRIYVAYAQGYHDTDQAKRWLAPAIGKASRPIDVSTALEQLGSLAVSAGKPTDALDYYREASLVCDRQFTAMYWLGFSCLCLDSRQASRAVAHLSDVGTDRDVVDGFCRSQLRGASSRVLTRSKESHEFGRRLSEGTSTSLGRVINAFL